MKLNKIVIVFVMTFSFLLLVTACEKKSQVIMGIWKGQDANGNNVKIVVSKNSLKIGNEILKGEQRISGQLIDQGPRVKIVGIIRDKELVVYYGFVMKNKQVYVIAFPKEGNKDIGLLIKSDFDFDADFNTKFNAKDNLFIVTTYTKGKMLYAMNRKSTPSYQEYAQKYLKAENE